METDQGDIKQRVSFKPMGERNWGMEGEKVKSGNGGEIDEELELVILLQGSALRSSGAYGRKGRKLDQSGEGIIKATHVSKEFQGLGRRLVRCLLG